MEEPEVIGDGLDSSDDGAAVLYLEEEELSRAK